ncbi:MAG: DNA translocase FtsK, partial [Spirochaetaceae bacterium]|nr:DNA translocase FtsK [Spirochaetaceae bacterium]
EEGDITDISGKLDPQGSEPTGILKETKAKPRQKKRKKYDVPVDGILSDYPESNFSSIDENTRKSAEVLEQTLKEFKIEAKVTGIRKGPVITMFELLPSPGVKISSIVNLQDNIALRLAASRVRIIAPIPGKHAVGIEVPNKKRAIVSFSSLVSSEEFDETDAGIPVILGKDISGGNQIIDLTRTPHLLIAGATGSGKSVCVNSLIGSILYSRTPREVKMIMVDPKIVELKLYNDIPHLLTPVITNPKRALQALLWCLSEMERRYSLLDSQGVRDIKTFNKRVNDRKLATEPLPYIVVIVDEFADLMATSGKELEAIVARLAAMSRAVGIHLVLATQRPSVDVITGLIKANFPSRIAFMVAGKTDSRIIIDSVGAEKLLGRGDMLFTSAWDPFPSRMQGAFLAEEEVERMADYVKTLGEPDYIDEEMFVDEEDEEEFQLQSSSGDDPMYNKALEIVVSSRKASASYLQRRLKIGYNRAARMVEDMERRGIVGPANGSKPRDLIHIPERFLTAGNPADREPSSA